MTYTYIIDNDTGQIRARGVGPLTTSDPAHETVITSTTLFAPGVYIYDFGLESFQLRPDADIAAEQAAREAASAAQAAAVTAAIDGLLLLPPATRAVLRAMINLPQELLQVELAERG